MEKHPHIHIERRGRVACIRLDRPPVNALDLPTLVALTEQVETVGQSGADALLLLGRDGAFSAGIDVKAALGYGPEDRQALAALVNRLVGALYDCPLPTVVAVGGHAVGGGLVMVLACDLRLGTDRPANLSLPEVRAGIHFPDGAMAVVRAELGPAVARRLVLGDLRLTPQEALEAGVLDALHPPEALEAAALAEAERLAGLPREIFLSTRRQLRRPVLEAMRAP